MNNNSEYFSLQEATQYCNYSQEYLSLRARQGKLKSVKFGRNWVTKKEWLDEYLEKAKEYNNFKTKKFVAPPENLPVKKLPVLRFGFVVALVFVLAIAGCVFGKSSFQNVFEMANPYVIKISEASDLAAKEIFEDTKNSYAQIPPLVPPVRDSIVSFATEISAGISNGVQEFSEGFDRGMAGIFKNVSSYTYLIGGAGDIIVENIIKVAADTISDIPQSFQYVNKEINSQLTIVAWDVASVGEVTADTFKEYGQWLGRVFGKIPKGLTLGYTSINNSIEEKFSKGLEELVIGAKYLKLSFEQGIIQIGRSLTRNYLMANNFIEQKLNQGYRAITQFWTPKKIVKEELIPKLGEGGIVVIPSSEKDKEVKKKIKEAFSDEVRVELKDKTSGIIIPIFKKGEGQKYLYMLVPVNIE